jgi:stage V sporulation protein G
MATKKTTTQNKSSEKSVKFPGISSRIDRLVDKEGSKIKAIASITVGGAFAIHGIKVMKNDKGLYVSMPVNSYTRGGKTEYSEVCHPVSAEARSALNESVLDAYSERLEKTMSESEDIAQEQSSFALSM